MNNTYWSKIWELGISSLNLYATPILDSGLSNAASVGVLITVAPRIVSTSTFSVLIFSGKVIYILYPKTAAASANPIPVLPDVASMRVSPFFICFLSSAYFNILYPILSFKLPPGFKNSHLNY